MERLGLNVEIVQKSVVMIQYLQADKYGFGPHTALFRPQPRNHFDKWVILKKKENNVYFDTSCCSITTSRASQDPPR